MRLYISKLALWAATIGSGLAIMLAVSTPVASAIDLFPDNVCKGSAATSAACSGDGKDNISGTDGVILRAAGIMSIIAGVVAVFMIMLGGFFFVTAGGDSGKVSSAKKTIIYAVVGLIVIVLARSIIVFIVSRV